MNASQAKTKEKLKQFVSELEEQSFPTSTVSIELAKFVAAAIKSYLEGESKSLDTAFGLDPKRGAPGFPDKRLDIAREILQMKLAGKSWKEITDEFATRTNNDLRDERRLRRIVKEFEIITMAEEIYKRLCDSDERGGNK